jgi:predicted Zn-dependent peptidase
LSNLEALKQELSEIQRQLDSGEIKPVTDEEIAQEEKELLLVFVDTSSSPEDIKDHVRKWVNGLSADEVTKALTQIFREALNERRGGQFHE